MTNENWLKMKSNKVKCPSCQSNQYSLIGLIPASSYFAGRKISNPIQGGSLYCCKSCHLYFRYPKLSRIDLEDSYTQSAGDGRWEKNFNERSDWEIAAGWIESNGKTSRVLDIGCNDGTFLIGLSSSHKLYGIELNPAASARAKEQGVEIIGSEFEECILEMSLQFDVVSAFDVIEHVDDPLRFLTLMASKLSPGGEIIISTGNSDAWAWKFMGSQYWYCIPPEHITFINLQWAQNAAHQLGLSLVETVSFAHFKGTQLQRFIAFLKNVAFKLCPLIFALRRSYKSDKGEKINLAPPSWVTARDHLILRFRK